MALENGSRWHMVPSSLGHCWVVEGTYGTCPITLRLW